MDVTSTRLANLKLLVSELQRQRGLRTKKEVAVELDMSGSFLSQLLGGKKLGDDLARKIEATRNLPRGWMDVGHGSDTANSTGVRETQVEYDPSQLLRMDPETISASIKLVRLTFETLDFEYDPEEDGVPLAFAYEYLSRRRERNVTPENLVDFRKALSTKLREQKPSEEQARTGIAGSVGGSDRGEGQGRKAG